MEQRPIPPEPEDRPEDGREELAALIRDKPARETHAILEMLWALGPLSKLRS
jgi:hypothetical protein